MGSSWNPNPPVLRQTVFTLYQSSLPMPYRPKYLCESAMHAYSQYLSRTVELYVATRLEHSQPAINVAIHARTVTALESSSQYSQRVRRKKTTALFIRRSIDRLGYSDGTRRERPWRVLINCLIMRQHFNAASGKFAAIVRPGGLRVRRVLRFEIIKRERTRHTTTRARICRPVNSRCASKAKLFAPSNQEK